MPPQDDRSISNIAGKARQAGLYRISLADEGCANTAAEQIQWSIPYVQSTVAEMLRALSKSDSSSMTQRICEFIGPRKDCSVFNVHDWMQCFDMSQSAATKDIRKAINLGLVEAVGSRSTGDFGLYRVVTHPIPALRLDGLLDEKKVHLQKLYDRFGTTPFDPEYYAEMLNIKKNSVAYRLEELVDRGLLIEGHSARRLYYRLAVSPDDHPECFLRAVADETMLLLAN